MYLIIDLKYLCKKIFVTYRGHINIFPYTKLYCIAIERWRSKENISGNW